MNGHRTDFLTGLLKKENTQSQPNKLFKINQNIYEVLSIGFNEEYRNQKNVTN